MRLPIPPVFSSNGQHLLDGPNGDGGMDGVREVLAGWVMRYTLLRTSLSLVMKELIGWGDEYTDIYRRCMQ